MLQKILFEVQQDQSRGLVLENEGILRLGTKLCVPDVDDMRKRDYGSIYLILRTFSNLRQWNLVRI